MKKLTIALTLFLISHIALFSQSANVYPNPANQVVNISYDINNLSTSLLQDPILIVIDMSGKTIVEDKISTNGLKSLDVSGWASGNYIYNIITDDKILVSKGIFCVIHK